MTIRNSRHRYQQAAEAYKTAHPGRDLTVARAELTSALMEYRLECTELVERLADVLLPFAKEAELWHKTTSDSSFIYTVRDANDLPSPHKDSPITLGDLRLLAKFYDEVSDV
jgi:hypothetical protein